MVADEEFIEYLRKKCRMDIPKELEDFLLEEYGEEPFPHENTEQDLYEQIRKLEIQYHKGMLNITLKGPEERLRMRYEELKDEYINAMYEVRKLEDEIARIKGVAQLQGVHIKEQFLEAMDCDEQGMPF